VRYVLCSLVHGEHSGGPRGRTVQVDPIKPKLKPPGAKRLKLDCDLLLSTSAFKFNVRRYTVVGLEPLFASYVKPGGRVCLSG